VNETTPTKAIDARVAYQTPRKIEGEENLYWRGAKIYARVRVDGKQCYRCTNTDKLPKARKVLAKWREDVVLRQHGIEPKAAALVRNRLTVGAVLTEYAESGYPDRSNRSKKTAVTVENERKCVQRLQAFFGMRAAVSLTLKDCDAYRKWRASGGYTWQRGIEKDEHRKPILDARGNPKAKVHRSKAGDRIVDIELQTLGNALTLAVRQEKLKANPLAGRQRYHREEETRHCREVAPTPQQLQIIERMFRQRG